MQIQAVSFDFWNTLVKPNPEFSKARNQCLAAQLGGLDEEWVSRVYTYTKHQLEIQTLETGCAHSVQQCFRQLCSNIFNGDLQYADRYHDVITRQFFHDLEELFFKYPPDISIDTISAIQRLYKAGFAVNIASNTNFITGYILREFLRQRVPVPFYVQLYSDVFGVASKPDALFFWSVYQEAKYKLGSSHPRQILHIGDDERFDGGAVRIGMQFAHLPAVEALPSIVDDVLRGRYDT